MTCQSALALRIGLGLAAVVLPALVLPAIDLGGVAPFHGSASAAPADSPEKEAFEAAKALGTVEAWDAFLSHYPSGFHADLARAYVKKLADQPQAASPSPSTAADRRRSSIPDAPAGSSRPTTSRGSSRRSSTPRPIRASGDAAAHDLGAVLRDAARDHPGARHDVALAV